MNEKKLSEQELAASIQLLQEQGKILASNVEVLTIYLQELTTSKVTLEGIMQLKKGDEILVPIGGSSFIKARIDDTEKVIVGIGANVSVDRTAEEASRNVEERINLIQSRIKENEEKYVSVAGKLEELSAEARELLDKKGENV